ncbi:hypothetical protein Tco_1108055 [Tanacetum coccineum]
MSKVLQERGSRSLPGSTKTNPRDYVKSISTTIETNTTSIPRIEGARYVVLDNQNIMQTFKPNQSTIPFPSRLTDDCYAEMNVFNSATYGAFEEGRRMKVPVERSMNEDILPQKEKHPGSFTLPCYINNVCFEKALADREASVSVMPLTTFTNLGLGGLALTKLTVELADRTIKYPKGVAENVIVGIIVENMDGYRDQDMGDVIFGETFCKASCVEARRFDRLITIHNVEWNLASVLKAQKFLQGGLNLGLEYIRDAKMEEWLTRGHISTHEME